MYAIGCESGYSKRNTHPQTGGDHLTTRHLELEFHAESHRDTPLQVQLGLVSSDPKAARKTVYEYFEAYRKCVRLLGRDFVPHQRKLVEPGYATAMDPDLIRKPDFDGAAPRAWGDPICDEDLMDSKEREWARFVKRIDTRVGRLNQLHSSLIRIRFLDSDPPPNDDLAHDAWQKLWGYSFGKYEKEKRIAVQMVAAGLGVTC